MDKIESLLTLDEIHRRIIDVAGKLNEFYQGEELVLVMVMKGAIFLTVDLMRQLNMPCQLECIKASSYGRLGTRKGELKISGIEELDLLSKNVLLIDDIFDTGETLSQILYQLQEQQPKTLRSLVLLKKQLGQSSTFFPDHVLFEIGDQFVVGYGLDYKERYRELPGVYSLIEGDV